MNRATTLILVLGSLFQVACRPIATQPKAGTPASTASQTGKADAGPAGIAFPGKRPKVDVAAVVARYRQPLPDEKEAFLAAIVGNGGVAYDSRGRISDAVCEDATDADIRVFAELKGLESLHIGSLGLEKPDEGWRAKPQVTDAGLASLAKVPRLRKLELFDVKISDEGLKTIGQMTGLEALAIESPNVTGPGMANLDALKNLTSLIVASSRLGDSGLRSIAGHAALRELCLDFDEEVTPRGLAELVRLNALEELAIWGRHAVNDDDLASIGKITKLITLRCDLKGVTDEGLRHMRKMSRLRSLDLTRTEATDAGMEYVGEMKGLQYLILNSYVGDAGVVKLRGLTNLRELSLYNSEITDACLPTLTACTQLQCLSLASTHVTAAGLARLRGMKNLWIKVRRTVISDDDRSKLQRSGVHVD